jgi:hypothetical protein
MTAQFPHNQSLQCRVRFYCHFLTSIPSFLHFCCNLFFTWRLTFIIRPVYFHLLRLCLFLNFLHSYFCLFKVCRFLFWTLTFVVVQSFTVLVSHFLSTSENKSSSKQNLVVLFLFFPFFKMVVFLYMLGVNSK